MATASFCLKEVLNSGIVISRCLFPFSQKKKDVYLLIKFHGTIASLYVAFKKSPLCSLDDMNVTMILPNLSCLTFGGLSGAVDVL
jgi:hypothetical protein